jgi:3-deoxy-D-manno-octulosonate 8-phosphate phosphatase (KDO 8-P phosphatase)
MEDLKRIKLLCLDVDGVLTDCRIWLDSKDEWRRFFSIRDGYGLMRLKEQGFLTAIITGSKAKDIRERAKALNIDYFFEGNLNKMPALEEIAGKSELHFDQIAYMGDDLFDLPLLKRVGFAATVPDALESVKKVCQYVTLRPGGNGAVREVCDLLLSAKGCEI